MKPATHPGSEITVPGRNCRDSLGNEPKTPAGIDKPQDVVTANQSTHNELTQGRAVLGKSAGSRPICFILWEDDPSPDFYQYAEPGFASRTELKVRVQGTGKRGGSSDPNPRELPPHLSTFELICCLIAVALVCGAVARWLVVM